METNSSSFKGIPHQCIVKGDGKFQNIAAASVLAKTHRDDYMKKISAEFPSLTVGIKTKATLPQSHRAAIQKLRQYFAPQKVLSTPTSATRNGFLIPKLVHEMVNNISKF